MQDDLEHPAASPEADPDTQSENQDSGQIFDDVDRRGFLKCTAWAGTGLIWSFAGGVPVSHAFGEVHHAVKAADLSFMQISDSHIGSSMHDFPIHTGDLTHTSKPAEFDTLDQLLIASKRTVDATLSGAPVEVHEAQPA